MGRDPRRTVILDTNIAIYAQDYADSGSEDGRTASEVLRAIGELGYTAVIAEATRADLQRGGNEHRAKRLRYAEHYPVVSPKSQTICASVPATDRTPGSTTSATYGSLRLSTRDSGRGSSPTTPA